MKCLRILLLGIGLWCSHVVSAGVVTRFFYDNFRPDPDPNNAAAVADINNAYRDPEQLRTRAGFPANPTRLSILDHALAAPIQDEELAVITNDEGEFYGSYVRGFIEPPMTGMYRFFIRSDDQGKFFLSTNATPQGLRSRAVCIEPDGDYTTFRPFHDDGIRSSDEIFLKKGEKYYFEVLHLEKVVFDFFSIGWRLPDGTLQRPIPVKYLWDFPFDPATLAGRNTAPLFLTPPASQVVREGETAEFSFDVLASQPAVVQWRKNGVAIPDANLSYLVSSPGVLGSVDQYDVVITNAFGGATSPPVVLGVIPDTVPPSIRSALTHGNLNGVDVEFSEPVADAAALNKLSYSIDQGVTVIGVKRLSPRSVRLETSSMPEGTVYTLTVKDVQDRATVPNAVLPGTASKFAQVHGVIRKKTFYAVPGSDLASFETATKVVEDNWDVLDYRNEFESPKNRGSDLGDILQGYIVPLADGNYTFYIASENEGALFLSPDSDPARKLRIAREPASSLDRQYVVNSGYDFYTRVDTNNPGPPVNMSAPQALKAGRKYYVEARFHKGGWGNNIDHLSVAWRADTDPPVRNGDAPIQALVLSAFGSSMGPVTITNQPASGVLGELDSLRLAVGVDGAPPYFYQWMENGAPIPGATNPVYKVDSIDRAWNGRTYSVAVSNSFSATNSTVLTLQVRFDDIPPRLLSARATALGNEVLVFFSERLDYSTATVPGNYQIAGLTVESATLLGIGDAVLLRTSAQEPGRDYELKVSGVADAYIKPNVIAPNSSVHFQSWPASPGTLLAEYYTNISGQTVAELTSQPVFPYRPDVVKSVATFALPENFGDNYGARLSGLIRPDKTGPYTFFLRSAHNAELYVSSGESAEAFQLVAFEDSCCQPFVADGKRSSPAIPLQAGKSYRISALLKAGQGPDYLQVAWRPPGDTTPLDQLGPIPAQFLFSLVPPASAELKITFERDPAGLRLDWPSGSILQKTDSLRVLQWEDVPEAAGLNQLIVPSGAGIRFFRLRQ